MNQFLEPRWKGLSYFPMPELPAVIAKWLLYAGSFSKKVITLLPAEPMRIQVLREGLQIVPITSYEYACFNCRYIYTREIKIFLANQLVMFAHSAVPKNAPLLFKRRFRGLGHQPLGRMLFDSQGIARSEFEIAKILPTDPQFKLATPPTIPPPSFLWGRRSVFSAQVRLLLLTEVFSPDLIRLIIQYESDLAEL